MKEKMEKRKKARRPYEKPELKVIELAAEEVLATGCKNLTSFGFGQPVCFVQPCIGDGS